jgi:DNA polymerase
VSDVERPGAAAWVPSSEQVGAAPGVEAMREAVPGCRGCELWEPATQAVFSAGPATASLVLVGEAPGDQEDQRGMPFVGPAGTLLVQAVTEAGIDPAGVYRTNAVKHFRFETRGKRRIHQTPDTAHVNACRPWLDAELARVDPSVVVALGATAGRALLGRVVRIGAERGTVLDGVLSASSARVVITAHPSSVLRQQRDPGYDEAFAALVADLRTAAAAV